jgi:hypothetical protein
MKNCQLIAAAAVTAGCYSYVPVQVDEVPLQTEVRAVLSTAGEISLRERVGLGEGRLRGELVERSADELVIAVPSTGPFTGSTERFYQRIDIPRADVLLVERREPATGKTVGLMVAAAGTATALAIIVFTGERNPGEGPPLPPGPDDHVALPLRYLLRIP